MPIDVTAARAATPGCQDLIHLNNAGAALPTHDVLTTQIDYLQLEARIGGYEAYTHEQARIEQIRPTIARLIGADPSGDEVALTVNNTAAFDLFLYSWAISPTHAPDPGDRILTTETEYGANFVAYLQLARRFGIEVEVVPSNDHGEIDLDALEASIRRTDVGPVTLIALNHIPTNGGLINPAAGVGAIAREYGITYLLDACQSAGQIPLDVDELSCDALTAAGRKFLRGPRGTGFLYVRASILPSIEPIMLDHSTAEWLEPDPTRSIRRLGGSSSGSATMLHCSASDTPSRRRSTMGSTPSPLEFRVSPRHFVAVSPTTFRRPRCAILVGSGAGSSRSLSTEPTSPPCTLRCVTPASMSRSSRLRVPSSTPASATFLR